MTIPLHRGRVGKTAPKEDEPSGAVDDVAISVVVPVFNEARYIQGAVRSILANDLCGGIEVLVVDGMSDDGTREVVLQIASEHPGVRLIDNPDRTVPHAMNLGVRAASSDVIVRVDGHAEIASDFLATCLAELDQHPECGCVGGPIEHVPEGTIAEAISMAMASPFGVGNASFRLGNREGYVDTVAFGAYRKAALVEIGLFDEALIRNQDDELNYRLRKAGYRIWLSQRIRSRYYARPTFRQLFRQYHQYGFWKVVVNRKHRAITTVRQLIPPVFVLGLAGLPLVQLIVPGAAWLLGALIALYVAGAVWFGLRKTRRPARLLRVVQAFATLHVAYGIGYLEGVVFFNLMGRNPRLRHTRVSR